VEGDGLLPFTPDIRFDLSGNEKTSCSLTIWMNAVVQIFLTVFQSIATVHSIFT